jgi:putative DNA primase/helicase
VGDPDNWPGDEEGDDDAPPMPDFDEGERRAIDMAVIAACASEPQNDTGNGQRLLKHFGAQLLNVREMSSQREDGWHYWAGQRWKREGGNEFATLCAQRCAPRIQLEADYIVAMPSERRAIEHGEEAAIELAAIEDKRAALDDDDRPELSDTDRAHMRALGRQIDAGANAIAALQKRQINRRKFAVSSGNGGKLREMLKAMLPHRTAAVEDMDKDPLAFNVGNGTLRFCVYEYDDPECPDPDAVRKKEFWYLRHDPHDPADLICNLSPVDYVEGAVCPRFIASLERFQPNAAKRLWLQKYFGYAITGLNGEQCMLFNYGGGSNWKSTCTEIVSRVMGDYAEMLKFESLAEVGETTGAQANPDFARLPGKRMVRVGESKRGIALNEGLIKSLTSGEPWVTRHNFGNFFSFYPSFKLVLSGNNKPDIGGVDHGIWRRIRFMIWPVTIADDERREMDEVIAELWEERAGILAWLVAGALAYLRDGLAPPQEILDETEEYREEQDVIGGFMTACVTTMAPKDDVDDPPFVPAQDMFDAFVRYCEANGIRAWKQKSFGSALSQKGLIRDRKSTLRRYLWVALHDVPAARGHGRHKDDPPYPADNDDEVPG